jgi:hypothetical protein
MLLFKVFIPNNQKELFEAKYCFTWIISTDLQPFTKVSLFQSSNFLPYDLS